MKRPSDGRGEYELAERAGAYSANDLINIPIMLDCAPFTTRETHVVPRSQGGKPRLRLTDNSDIHLHRQVAALMLLPKPVRDEAVLPTGVPVVKQNAYVLRKLDIDNLTVGADAVLRLGQLELDNASKVPVNDDFGDRLIRVRGVHDRAAELPSPLRDLLMQHSAVAAATTPVPPTAERLVFDIMQATATAAPDFSTSYAGETDVLPVLETMLAPATGAPPPSVTTVPVTEIEIRRRVANEIRTYLSRRGVRTAAFRRNVKEAYNYTCAVCGLRYPRTAFSTTGVDAAHILPWATYDLDVVANGLCLCKLHHWAFDEQLIAIRADGIWYEVYVTARGRSALASAPATLATLDAIAGVIPATRLPANPADQPRREFFDEFYKELPV